MSLVVNEPVGVVGAVVAWNFPILLASWKLAHWRGYNCDSTIFFYTIIIN